MTRRFAFHASGFCLVALTTALGACSSSSGDDSGATPNDGGTGDGSIVGNDGGSGDSGPKGDSGASTITVAGSVLNPAGAPIPGVPVIVGSAAPVLTDTSGHFTVNNVTTPYDASVIYGDTKIVNTYEGLTRPDPVLFQLTSGGTLNSQEVSGTLSGGSGYPQPVLTETVVQFSSASLVENSPVNVTGAATTFDIAQNDIGWSFLPSVSGSVYALQYTHALNVTQPTAYTGFGSATGITLTNSGNPDAIGTIALTAGTQTASTTLGATITAPAGYTVNVSFPTLVVGGVPILALPGASNPASGTISYPLPSITGATAQLQTNSTNGDGAGSISIKYGLALGSTGTAVTLLTAPVAGLPVTGATGVDNNTAFSWTQVTGGIHVANLNPVVAGSPSYFIVTADTTAKIPDVSAAGITLPKTAAYNWVVLGLAPFASVDAFSTGARFPNPTATEVEEVNSKSLSFSTAP